MRCCAHVGAAFRLRGRRLLMRIAQPKGCAYNVRRVWARLCGRAAKANVGAAYRLRGRRLLARIAQPKGCAYNVRQMWMRLCGRAAEAECRRSL